MKRKNKISIGDKLKGYIPLFVFFGTILNFIVIFRYESKSRPQIVYNVATNVVEKVKIEDEKTNSEDEKVKIENKDTDIIPPNLYNVYYDYFTLQGVRAIRMFERYYNEGSRTSYGIIKTIFPDKVFLENGDILVNQKWVGFNPLLKDKKDDSKDE